MASRTLWRGRSSRRRPSREDDLDEVLSQEALEAERVAYEAGVPMVATVTGVKRLGSTHAYPFVLVEIALRVPMVREVPFQVKRIVPVRAGRVPQAGQSVRVVYEPTLPRLVAFETEPDVGHWEGLPLVPFD